MEPIKKIETLEAKRVELKQQLAAPGIDKDREIAIRHNIDSVTGEITAYASKLPQQPAPEPDIYLPIVSWLTGREFPAGWSTSAAYITALLGVPPLIFGSFWRGRLAFFYFRMNRAILPRTTIARYRQRYHLDRTIEQLEKDAVECGLCWEKDAAKAAGQGIGAFLGVMWSRYKFFSPPKAGGGNK